MVPSDTPSASEICTYPLRSRACRHESPRRATSIHHAVFRLQRTILFKGAYHGEFAIILRNFAKSEKKDEYLKRAIGEFQMADQEFKLARNPVFRADVKNNFGLLLGNLSRFKEAHKYLSEARRLSVRFKDKARPAQYDESAAQVFIAEGKFNGCGRRSM